MKSRTSIWVSAVALVALGQPIQSPAQHTRYKLIDIGTLGGPSAHGPGNGPGSQLLNNGSVVVGTADTSTQDPNCGCFVPHGFRWQDGVLADLGVLSGGEFSGANAINARGWIAGFSQNREIDPVSGDPVGHAVLWTDDGMIDLGTLGAGVQSAASYVKDGGQVVGNATIDITSDPFAFSGLGPFSSPSHVFTWKNGVMQDLGTLGGPDSFAAGGCNNQRDDLVAGTSFVSSTPNSDTGLPTADPFLWENGKMKDLGNLGGTFGFAQCANDAGQVIGQSSLTGDVGCDPSDPFDTCDEHAFFWDHEALKDLGTLGGSFSVAFWLNEKGEAVGGATTTDDESFHATVWRNGRTIDLGTLDGDCFSIAWAINSKSQIVGQSFNCDTNTSETVLWENGSIFDLNVASEVEPLNINDRGEITGVDLPNGCDDSDSCGRAFLLIPCDNTTICEADTGASAALGHGAVSTKSTISNLRTPTERIAAWRAHLSQRYRIPGLPMKVR
jgi:probable HAF family extracellular repeat protein